MKSINTVPVRLAKDHLTIPPIKAMAEAMGVESPVEFAQDHGARHLGHDRHGPGDRLQRLRQWRLSPALRHGITQLLTRSGDVFYDFDKDAPPPRRVLSEQALSRDELDAGADPRDAARRGAPRCPTSARPARPARRNPIATPGMSALPATITAAVWLGNDDFSPTRKMTGGSLPAMVWQRLMAYAHQNIDLKPIPGIENPFVDAEVAAKAAEAKSRRRKKTAAAKRSSARRAFGGDHQARCATCRTLPRRPAIERRPSPKTLSAL